MIPDPEADNAYSMGDMKTAIHDLEEKCVRDSILKGVRADGRDGKTLRAIECEVNMLPRVHGSALFQRGETQYSKKFMLDYNFPSFSVGECRPIRGPGRREIGHGALAERSIKPVLPGADDFPYTIRIVSDILESNGSSSMATVCGTTLGLMAAGVKIKNPVAGISVGMVKEGDDYQLLTDILGLDLKIRGISLELLKEAMAQSRVARIEILRTMLKTLPRPESNLSENAPRLLVTTINPEKIGMLIGPGGKNIRAIQEETNTVVEVSEDGRVTIAGADGNLAEAALKKVEAAGSRWFVSHQ